ncbi:MAG: hypothetical protein K2Y03_12825 [Sphingomonas sp.]|nr:hypothetical protein [Sphingomonas sp.]
MTPDGDAAPPAPAPARQRWVTILAAILTLGMVAGLARALYVQGVERLIAAFPANPLFYIAFAAFYLSLPLGDFVIYRRLWGIPAAGLGALIRKRIANEVLFGYSGEAYFFAWAKAEARHVKAPFGAVKDVSILSALAGNAVTIALIVAALPFAGHYLNAVQLQGFALSALVVVGTSLPFLVFGRRVFSLTRPVLWEIFGIHVARVAASSALLALVWHAALPQVAIGTWLLLVALRMLTGRLPFVPNNELLFANFAILFLSNSAELTVLIALTAALTLVVHAALLGVFGAAALLRRR